MLHESMLSDLQLQAVRGQAGRFQNVADVSHHISLSQLLCGEVYADPQRFGAGNLLLPYTYLAARLAQHPPAKRDNQPTLLGNIKEFSRHEQPALWVLPAHKRLN